MTTLQAIHNSIAHWERLRDGVEGEEPLTEQCDLCNKFLGKLHNNCMRCPVYKRTGQILCQGSPYYKAHKLWASSNFYDDDWDYKEQFQQAAQEEIDFLRSLLCDYEYLSPPNFPLL